MIAALFLLRASPAFAVHDITFSCNGGAKLCDVFQLDGASNTTANADTCVGSENGCPSEESPVWPADWDPLIFPGNFGATFSTFTPSSAIGSGTGAGTFTTPWGKEIAFSGVVPTGGVIATVGTKLLDNLNTYTVKVSSSPPKDAFVAGALAAYTNPVSGDQQIYFGDTRSTSNGSATIGIMFNQENVQLCANGTQLCVDGTSTLATHKNGDLILFVQFGGTGFSTIAALKFNGTSFTSVQVGSVPGCG